MKLFSIISTSVALTFAMGAFETSYASGVSVKERVAEFEGKDKEKKKPAKPLSKKMKELTDKFGGAAE